MAWVLPAAEFERCEITYRSGLFGFRIEVGRRGSQAGAGRRHGELGQDLRHLVGVLGHRPGQHRADLPDIGATRSQHQPQMGLFEAAGCHRPGVDETLTPGQQWRQPRVGVVVLVAGVQIGHHNIGPSPGSRRRRLLCCANTPPLNPTFDPPPRD